MKNFRSIIICTILLIFLGLGLLCKVSAQEIQYEEYSLRILVNNTISEEKVIESFKKDSLLDSWIQTIRPSFPLSQDEMLQRIYHLDYTCSRTDMESRLRALSWIEEIMPIEKTGLVDKK